MMGLTPVLMTRALFLCVLTVLLVLLVASGLAFFLPTVVSFNCEVFAFFVFISKGVKSRVGQLIQMFLALKFLIFPPNFKTSFLVVVMV